MPRLQIIGYQRCYRPCQWEKGNKSEALIENNAQEHERQPRNTENKPSNFVNVSPTVLVHISNYLIASLSMGG